MIQEMGHVLGSQATGRLATSALPGAPVLSECPQRQGVARRLLGALTDAAAPAPEARPGAGCYPT